MTAKTVDVLVKSPSHKCSLDLKVRGMLRSRTVKTVKGRPSVRLGNRWEPVSFPEHPAQPARVVVPSDMKVSGLK